MDEIIRKDSLQRLKAIHALSREYNGLGVGSHQEKLLLLVRKHIDEIEVLYANKDAHANIEVGDLIILCLELLLENNVNIDDVFSCCFGRYEKKLTELLNERKTI